ncbi:hypothetical protein DFQ30_005438 [Apophysomyces sp. BC1015]|nr:hypothetical protein DFQ30_005438 [Apophysomyces sp. BC1015]
MLIICNFVLRQIILWAASKQPPHPADPGTNVIPLGANKRRFVEGPAELDHNDRHSQQVAIKADSGTNKTESAEDNATNNNSERRRKRRSRWGDEDSKVNTPGLPTALPKLSKEQTDRYVLQIRLGEIDRKLRTGDYVPPERERSPSPEPVYDAQGKRVNTREARYRKRLEDERHKLIDNAIRTIPGYRPPLDYKRPSKLQEKVYIPAKEFPEINFIGLLIGPRGNTLKGMESDSGAKISIRGRGSVKEGKSRTDAAANAAQEEELHCLVTADSEEKVRKAVKLIEKIIETSASVPEGQNELKRQQLRELAALNGTLRDDENQTCMNCGALGHRRYECPERQNFTASLTCHICGTHGHTARDCLQRGNPEFVEKARERNQQLDSEYMNLMAELGEKVPENGGAADGYGDGGRRPYGDKEAPWQQRPAGGAAPWHSEQSGAAPPWAAAGQAPAAGGAAPWTNGGYGSHNDGYYQSYGQNPYGAYGGYGGYGGWEQQPADGYGQAPPPPPPPESAPPPPPPGPTDEAAPPPPPQ